MNLVETLESQTRVLRVSEVAELFQVTPQHIYKMAANRRIPSFRVAGAIRFDPQELANWLRSSPSIYASGGREMLRRTA
ncbi:MAG: helix-turn-helix domain-containing protein [Acidobacteriaceae bacterium]